MHAFCWHHGLQHDSIMILAWEVYLMVFIDCKSFHQAILIIHAQPYLFPLKVD